jgi:hypothetical protein
MPQRALITEELTRREMAAPPMSRAATINPIAQNKIMEKDNIERSLNLEKFLRNLRREPISDLMNIMNTAVEKSLMIGELLQGALSVPTEGIMVRLKDLNQDTTIGEKETKKHITKTNLQTVAHHNKTNITAKTIIVGAIIRARGLDTEKQCMLLINIPSKACAIKIFFEE